MGNTLHVIREWIKYTGEKDLGPDQENSWGNEYEVDEIPYRMRILFSTVPLTVLLVFSQIGLSGRIPLRSTSNSWTRIILASTPGTLMELGILPILTAKLILGLLPVTKIIGSSTQSFLATEKLLEVLVILVYAICYTHRESPTILGLRSRLAVIIQLLTASIIVSYMNEIHRKFGLATNNSGERSSSIFLTLNFYELIIRGGFSPYVTNTGRGTEFIGAIPAFLHLLSTRQDKIRGIREALFRQNLPNLFNFWGTCFLFGMILCFKGHKTTLPIQYTIGFALLTTNFATIWPYPFVLLGSYVDNCVVVLSMFTTRLYTLWPYPFDFFGSLIMYCSDFLRLNL